MKFSERNENRMRELVELRAIRDALAQENATLRGQLAEARELFVQDATKHSDGCPLSGVKCISLERIRAIFPTTPQSDDLVSRLVARAIDDEDAGSEPATARLLREAAAALATTPQPLDGVTEAIARTWHAAANIIEAQDSMQGWKRRIASHFRSMAESALSNPKPEE